MNERSNAKTYEQASAAGIDLVDLEARAKRLVHAAQKAGASAADAYVGLGQSQSVAIRHGDVEVAERSESDGFTLRVFVGDKHASVSSNMPSEEEMLAERAVAMAKVSPNDPFATLGDRERLATELPDLDLFDGTRLSSEELADLAKRSEATALAVTGITNTNSAGASQGTGGMVLATSDGFVGSSVSSSFGVSISAVAGEGTAMQRDYDYSSKRHYADLANPEDIGRNAAERTLARLNPRKVETGTYTVILDPRCANSMIGHLAGAINGAAIARQTSFLKDSLGEQVLARGVTIRDDPHILRGPASRPCDGEGVQNGALTLVDDGVLTEWLLDTGTAKELGLVTNGRSGRGSPSTPNIYIKNGSRSPQDLLAEVERGIYVTDFIGSGVNGVTGDYSRGVSGFLIEKGEIREAVSEITIAGNLKDMFLQIEPANDLEFRYSANSPTLSLGQLTVAGN
ncbi:MAG: TldD/PmbA family protein [Pseudomonadota bacterium]